MDELSIGHLAWLERQHDRAENTIASRRRVLNSITNPGTATRADVITWWESRAHLADGTRAVDRSHLKEFYRWCMIYEHRADDPSVILRPVTVENALPAKISNDQIRELLDTLPADLRRAVMLGAFAGLRVSESAALDWSEGGHR